MLCIVRHCYWVQEFDNSFFFQIFAPIVDSLHWSLVAVSTRQKKNFILDSGIIDGELINQTQADTVLRNLQSILRSISEHGEAISEFETLAPFVPTQDHE